MTCSEVQIDQDLMNSEYFINPTRRKEKQYSMCNSFRGFQAQQRIFPDLVHSRVVMAGFKIDIRSTLFIISFCWHVYIQRLYFSMPLQIAENKAPFSFQIANWPSDIFKTQGSNTFRYSCICYSYDYNTFSIADYLYNLIKYTH